LVVQENDFLLILRPFPAGDKLGLAQTGCDIYFSALAFS